VRRVSEVPVHGKTLPGKRPPRELVLALLFFMASLLGFFAAMFPIAETQPVTDVIVASSVGTVAGVSLFFFRSHISDRIVVAYALLGTLLLSFLIANATTQLGTAVAAMPYMWFCVYFGAYLEPRVVRILVALICALLGAALIISEVPTEISFWVIYSATLIVTTESLLATSHALRMQARLDPLTGLLNRRGLEEAAGPVVAMGGRIGSPTTLAMIDLDEFKKINDSEGHSAGDQTLQNLARSWIREQRDSDLLSRVGGDEFVIVMTATGLDQAEHLITRYQSAHPVRWSYGMVEIRDDESLLAAIDRADQVLYENKAQRNEVD